MTTIADIALGSDDFDILVAALQFVDSELDESDLVATLSSEHVNLTVFAPTDTAFGGLARDVGFDGDVADEAAVTGFLAATFGAETLFGVITYHVLGAELFAADIAALDSVHTLSGGTIGTASLPTLTDREPDLLDPSLIATDIDASNGVVHVIDRVLLPVDLPGNDAPTITELVAASGGAPDDNRGDFDILLNAVTAAGLGDALNNLGADLTVFAPTDGAFVGAAQAIGFAGNGEAGAFTYITNALELLGGGDAIPLLTTILTYHVAPGSLQSSEVLTLTEIPTLQGTTIGRDGTTLLDADPDLADPNLIALDIQAANGIIHVIDGVLLPIDVTLPPAPSDFFVGNRSNETISTGAGADLIHGAGGADTIFAGSAADFVIGGSGADRIFGHAGTDTILGGDGGDTLRGGRGSDTIDGGAGRDMLMGGRGTDTFVFAAGNDRDIIRDLDLHQDWVDLSSFGFDGLHDFRDAVHISEENGSTRIDFGGGDLLVLRGVAAHEVPDILSFG